MHYVVYTKGEVECGFAEGEGFWLLRTSKGESKKLKYPQMVSNLGHLLRQGFVKDPSLVFWDKRAARFTRTHPDLASGGTDWVLGAEPPDLTKGIDAVAQRMCTSASAEVLHPVEINAWVKRQKENEKLIVAFRDHPAWALLIAEMALESGWLLRVHPEMGTMPQQSPATASTEWDAWLAQTFPATEVSGTRVQLGLSLGRAFQSASSHPVSDDDSGLLGI